MAKQPRDAAMLGPFGFEGDRHASDTVRLAGGRRVPNRRQWSAVSSEEVEDVCAALGVDSFPPGALGENLRLRGLRLAELTAGAELRFPSGAVLRVEAQNEPCINAASALAVTYGRDAGQRFILVSLGRRGVVGSVLAPGEIRKRDSVELVPAASQPQPGEAASR